MSNPILEVSDLHRRFGAVAALRSASFTLASGELALVVGPNGAGKSTLLRTIAGLTRPTRGQVRVHGRDVHRDTAARGAIGLLSHHGFLYGDLSVRENLQFTAALHQITDRSDRIATAIMQSDLARHADVRAGRLSRGMQQRLAIARATLHQPSLLLLDEPFTGLDARAAASLRERIASEVTAARAVLCVTHSPDELWELATRVIMLVDGRVVSDAARPASFEAFRAAYLDVLAA